MLPERYQPKEMEEIWNDKSKYDHWLQVELALIRARVSKGEVSQEDYEAIARNSSFSVERIEEIDAEIQHDLQAFVDAVRESLQAAGLGDLTGQVHRKITSYDTEDPATMVMLIASARLIRQALDGLYQALLTRAFEHKYTLYSARTHGQDAEPDTFGRLLLTFADDCTFALQELDHITQEVLPVGKISGAIGNYADVDPELEKMALRFLDLKPVRVSTQIVQRSRHATYLSWIATTGGSLERMSKTFWIMMHSSIRELREPRSSKQKGSSAMPHKKNPILTERLMGMVRLLRAYAMAAQENIATPECRDISQSSVERIIFPDSTSLLYYMLKKATGLVNRLEVFPERMQRNLYEGTHGTWASQQLKTALVDAGVDPEITYRFVQEMCFRADDEDVQLLNILQVTPIPGDPENRSIPLILGDQKLAKIFDPMAYTKPGVEIIFARFTK